MAEEQVSLEKVKEKASSIFNEAKDSAGKIAGETADKIKSLTGDKSWWEKTKSWAGDTYDKGSEYVGKTLDTVKAAGKDMDDKSNGWLGNNKGLLIGGLVALFAVFGMQGGSIWPSLIAVGALLAGAFFVDKDNGMFSKMFKKDEPSQSNGVSKQVQPTTPSNELPSVTPPAIQQSVQPSRSKNNKAYIGFNGGDIYVDVNGINKTPPLDKIPDLMHIKVDRTGKATHVSVADESGKSLRIDGKEQMVTIVNSDIKFDISVDNNGAKHINLNDEKNIQKTQELRKIGTEALGKNKGDKRSSLKSDTEYSSLGTLASPYISASAKKEQNQTSV